MGCPTTVLFRGTSIHFDVSALSSSILLRASSSIVSRSPTTASTSTSMGTSGMIPFPSMRFPSGVREHHCRSTLHEVGSVLNCHFGSSYIAINLLRGVVATKLDSSARLRALIARALRSELRPSYSLPMHHNASYLCTDSRPSTASCIELYRNVHCKCRSHLLDPTGRLQKLDV